MTAKLQVEYVFDPEEMRHYLNGENVVLHCHHYSGLFTQLADDAKLLGGAKILSGAAEDAFYPVLTRYFAGKGLASVDDRVAIAEQYYSLVGLGKVRISLCGDGWSAEMEASHVDEGWIKKWGRRKNPVNFVGQGYLAAALAAVEGKEPGSFHVEETQSIVSGAPVSRFEITRKRGV